MSKLIGRVIELLIKVLVRMLKLVRKQDFKDFLERTRPKHLTMDGLHRLYSHQKEKNEAGEELQNWVISL